MPLPPGLLGPLTERVRRCAEQFATAVDVGAPDALQLLVDSARRGGCCVDAGCCPGGGPMPRAGARAGAGGRAAGKRLWLQVVADICLTDSQIACILSMRRDLLRELNGCYARREAIARGLLAEAAAAQAGARRGSGGASGAGAAAGSPVGGAPLTVQADRMRQGGYLLDVARGSLAVRQLTDEMQVSSS